MIIKRIAYTVWKAVERCGTFNHFVNSLELVDISMVGRKFTRYRPNNLAKSRLHSVGVSWLAKNLDKQ